MTARMTKWGDWIVALYAALLILVGLVLAVGGVALIRYGGSFYYLVAGFMSVLSGVLLLRRDGRGRWAYGALLAGTLAWALAEVGLDGWALVPRLVAPFVLGAGLLLPPVRRLPPARPLPGQGAWMPGGWRAMGAGLMVALLLGFGLHAAGPGAPDEPVLRRGMAAAPARLAQPIGITAPGLPGEWASFGNDAGGTRFSPLDQINLANVATLAPAWTADVGPRGPGADNGLQAVPLMVGDTLYLCNGYNVVQALDPDSGATRWRTDISRGIAASGKPCRGVAFARVPGATGACAERIIGFNQTPELVALDARTGRPCAGFGTGGYVSLEAGINPHPKGHYYISSAPQVIRGKVVVGGGIPDGQEWGGPSGVIRAFDIVTGRLAWAFDAGYPQRTGAPPPGETYTPSSPNSWAPISADEALGLVYLPMGNATPDYFGAQRRPFDDAISSAVIALDAGTGRLRWRFQTTHHDIWDYDVPSQPTLVDLPTPSGLRRALIQPTKRGEIFVLDRATGRPIFPVREVAVPQGDIAGGERLSPTQPVSIGLPAFRGRHLREADAWGTTPLDQLLCRIRFAKSRYQGPFTPMTPGRPVIVDPGYSGGVNWGSVSIDVDRGIMVVNWMQLPNRVELLSRAEADKRGYAMFDGQAQGGPPEMPMENTPHGAFGGPFLSPLGTPCMVPPWGMIGAVDLASGKLIWHHPLGTARDSGPFGIPSMVPITVGAPMTGGSVTTRGGLTFIAASAERAIRAIDVATGRELWKARLPFGGQSSPMTYRSPRTGRQYVVISAGGRKSLKTKSGHALVAYALPATGGS